MTKVKSGQIVASNVFMPTTYSGVLLDINGIGVLLQQHNLTIPIEYIWFHFVKVFFSNQRPEDSSLIAMKLTDQVIKSFKTAKVFKENTDIINSLNFSPQGDTLISSSDDDQIVIYDCLNGT